MFIYIYDVKTDRMREKEEVCRREGNGKMRVEEKGRNS